MVLGAVGVLPGTVWVPMLPQTRSVATCVDAWVAEGRPQASSATLAKNTTGIRAKAQRLRAELRKADHFSSYSKTPYV
jgi:hypothetical protein